MANISQDGDVVYHDDQGRPFVEGFGYSPSPRDKYIEGLIKASDIAVPAAVDGAIKVTAAKQDAGKRKWGLLMGGAGLALEAIVEVLELGAAKYAANAWQSVPDGFNRYKDALYRHMRSVEENGPYVRDVETGKLELAHVGCNALFMLWFAIKGKA